MKILLVSLTISIVFQHRINDLGVSIFLGVHKSLMRVCNSNYVIILYVLKSISLSKQNNSLILHRDLSIFLLLTHPLKRGLALSWTIRLEAFVPWSFLNLIVYQIREKEEGIDLWENAYGKHFFHCLWMIGTENMSIIIFIISSWIFFSRNSFNGHFLLCITYGCKNRSF